MEDGKIIKRLLIVAGIVLIGTALVIFRGAKERADEVRAYRDAATNNRLLVCGQGEIMDLEGNTYKTVEIDGLCWMQENLKYIPKGVALASTEAGNESMIDPRYYLYGYEKGGFLSKEDKNDPTSVYNTYGVLYNWPAAMESCPPETHLPTDREWYRLEKAFWEPGPDIDEYCSIDGILGLTGYDRCAPAGLALKATSWGSGVGKGTNISGFNALPGGLSVLGGSFFEPGSSAHFWTSSVKEGRSWNRSLGNVFSTVYRDNINRAYGFSVRCIR